MLGFWKTTYGSLFNHQNGLTKEQVDFFKSLKEGDRIVLSPTKVKSSTNSPDAVLRKWLSEEEYKKTSNGDIL